MKTLFRIMTLLIVLSLTLAACSPADQTEAPGGAQPTTGAQPAATEPVGTGTEAPDTTGGDGTGAAASGSCASANGQTVEMWSPLTGPDGDEMTALADRYTSENADGITVRHVAQPEYVQKLNAAAAAGQMPTMTVVRAINVAELAERNVLQPFSDEVLAVLGDQSGEFPENVWVAGEYEGERYSFPLDMHPLVMYYNKAMFEAAGVPEPGNEPMTREEFESALEALQSDSVQAIAVGTAFNGATLFQTLIRQFGGGLTDETGETVTYNSDAGVQALEYIKNLYDTYSPGISGAGDPEVNVFKQEQAAIVIHGPWHISDLQRLDFVGFAPVPQIGDQFAVWAGSHQLGITNEDPAQQVAAACWIKWLSENSVEWAKAGQVPARNSVRLGDELAQVAAPIAAVAPSADSAIILPQIAELEGALWGQFGAVVDGVMMGEVTDIKAALDDAAARSQQIIDENKARYE